MSEGKEDEGRDAGTRVPSAEGANKMTSEEPEREDLVGPTGVSSSTPLEMLARHGVEAAVEEAVRPSQCEGGSYVELDRNRTRTKVTANPELIAQDQKYRTLEERYNFLQDQWALTRKLQKAALKMRDEMVMRARRKIDELRAKVETDLSVKQVQIRNLTEELVRKTRALEESEVARRADEELLGRLQSECEEFRAQRAAAEVQLAELEDHNRRTQIARGRN
ncbi:hypothetical protein AXG93_1681s1000 [Marchantia polymorpha subsp. ruderalis]|uniref:Uncharacterized protein n=1 Tax=Marchantia polymorpha subsp. ruderalis TaxID=1480154 RepID=A0A176VVG5_MARPO|nr:hypothetical protein AXG93_1681s1000 [Marchantia polymorpha subsp. ruderalis]